MKKQGVVPITGSFAAFFKFFMTQNLEGNENKLSSFTTTAHSIFHTNENVKAQILSFISCTRKTNKR